MGACVCVFACIVSNVLFQRVNRRSLIEGNSNELIKSRGGKGKLCMRCVCVYVCVQVINNPVSHFKE